MAFFSSSHAPILLRPHNFQWYWNSSNDPWAKEESWMKYTDIENEIIEDAYNYKRANVEIDGNYVIDLNQRIQYRKDDSSKQRPIKRVQLNRNRSNVHLREERFSLPVTISSVKPDIDDNFKLEGKIVSTEYFDRESLHKYKTIADVVEEAAQGIIKEGTNVGKVHDAEWLAQQLLHVKQFGANVVIEADSPLILGTNPPYYLLCCPKISPKIGETFVYLYTLESFWYKLMNQILRDPETVTREHIKTLGPFCFLLRFYLRQIKTTNILTVYRGLTLTDEQCQIFLNKNKVDEYIMFTAFTSTSKNRKKAEQFGNTLLIIELNKHRFFKERNPICGAHISHLSDFPDEEEFLIWERTLFSFVKQEYDSIKNKISSIYNRQKFGIVDIYHCITIVDHVGRHFTPLIISSYTF